MEKIDDLAFWNYNALDSDVLKKIDPKLTNELEAEGNTHAYEIQSALLQPLLYMMARGIRMDTEGIKKASTDIEKEITRLTLEIVKKSDGVIGNPNSPKQVMEYFYVHKGVPPYISLTTKKITTDELALKRLARPISTRPGFEVASLLLKHRGLSKLKGTYLDITFDDDNRMRSFFSAGRTVSGRLSSSKTLRGTGLNMQTNPPPMKTFMLADEGYTIYNVDLAQAENRIVANIGPEPRMLEAFNRGDDIHSLTGALISGLSPQEVKRQDDEGIKCEVGNGLYTWRFWGKKANHGLNYGLGYRNFALKYSISEADAKLIIEGYHSAYPGVRKYHGWVRDQLEKGRTLTNILGRRRKFLGIWGHDLFKEAYNWIPQSSVSSIINERGLLHIHNGQEKYEYVEPLLQVHDSIVFQIPNDVGWEYHASAIAGIKASLETELEWMDRRFIIEVEVEMGRNLGHMRDNNPLGLREIKWTDSHLPTLEGHLKRQDRIMSSVKAPQ